MPKQRWAQLPMSIPFQYIDPRDRSHQDTCACGDTTAYKINGNNFCLVCAEKSYPSLYFPLPESVKVEIYLDPIGEEKLDSERYKKVKFMRCLKSVAFPCRVLPGTEDADKGFIRFQGMTCAGALARVREIIYDWDIPRQPKHVIVTNYGFSIYVDEI